jgi:hypothetical protein
MALTQTHPPPIPSLAILSLILLILLLPWPHEHTKPAFTTALSVKDYNSYPHILYFEYEYDDATSRGDITPCKKYQFQQYM